MNIKQLLIIMFGLFGVFGCSTDKKLEKIVNELQNTDKGIRSKAIEKLEKFKITKSQQIYLLNEAVKDFPPAIYDWQTISGILIDKGTQTRNDKLIPVIKNNFNKYNGKAKDDALRYLTKFDNKNAILLFKELILKHHSELHYQVPTGILKEKYKFKDIVFPDLINIVQAEKTDFNILLLLLDYLKAKELDLDKYKKYTDLLIKISKEQISIIKQLEKTEVDIWYDDDYNDAKYKAGIIADLLGYFKTNSSINELKQYLPINDSKLKMFAIKSLINLGQKVDEIDIESVASDPETRNWTYDKFKEMQKEQLFPKKYKNQTAFAESDMVNWLIYPTELARTPDKIELMNIVEIDTESNDGIVEFYIFRFKSDHKDWKDKGWMVGLSGYFLKKDKPSTSSHGYTFSTFEKWDEINQDDYVQEVMEILNEVE